MNSNDFLPAPLSPALRRFGKKTLKTIGFFMISEEKTLDFFSCFG